MLATDYADKSPAELPLLLISTVTLFLLAVPLLTTSLFPNILLFVEFFGRVHCLLLVEVYLITFTHSRAIVQKLVLGLHTRPIILMGFIPGHIRYM